MSGVSGAVQRPLAAVSDAPVVFGVSAAAQYHVRGAARGHERVASLGPH
jgi:hypothetical protein